MSLIVIGISLVPIGLGVGLIPVAPVVIGLVPIGLGVVRLRAGRRGVAYPVVPGSSKYGMAT